MAKYDNIEWVTQAFKALGDENRLRAALALKESELCVCQITELLQLAPSTVSKHMTILKQAGLVESRKDGRWMYYRLARPESESSPNDLLGWILRLLENDRRKKEDDLRLNDIQKVDPEELCRQQISD